MTRAVPPAHPASPGAAAPHSLQLASGARCVQWLRTVSAGLRGRIVCALLLLAVAAVAELALPLGLGRLVDAVESGSRADAVAAAVLALSGLLAAAAGGAAAALLLSSGLERVLGRVRERVATAALRLPAQTAEALPSGELVSRASDDVEALREATSEPVPALAASGAAVATMFAGLLALHPGFFGAALLAVPVQLFALRRYLRRAPALYRQERAAVSRRSSRLFSSVQAREAIRAYGTETAAQDRCARSSWAAVRVAMLIRAVQSTFFFRLNLAELIGTGALMVAAFLLVDSGQVTLGEATAALLLFISLFGPIGTLLLVIDDVQAASAALSRVVGLVDTAAQTGARADRTPAGPAIAERPLPHELSSQHSLPAIELREACLSLGRNQHVLASITLSIPAGQRVALVGASGAGKTSLARVIAGQLPLAEGSVRVHGADPHSLSDEARAALVAVVDQDPYVFSLTLAENLRIAAPAATPDALAAACRFTGISADLDAECPGDDGSLPHRLALARAFLRPSPVIVLDEMTAAADGSAARDLDQAARGAFAGRTQIIIAHRLSHAEACDRIIVLDRGRVVEDGAPHTLRQAGGAYAELWEAWEEHR